jgi:FXSXX-COOH protein
MDNTDETTPDLTSRVADMSRVPLSELADGRHDTAVGDVLRRIGCDRSRDSRPLVSTTFNSAV